LIGICERSTYEGHAAMLLQAEAEQSSRDGTHDYIARQHESRIPISMDWECIIRGILQHRRRDTPASAIAARFHRSLAALIADGASIEPDLPVILCGGCFQNALLLELAVHQLERDGRQVYWPHRLPPNDGAISAGQVFSCLPAMKSGEPN